MKILEFIQTHKHICYCEIIVSQDGEIHNICPSHTETLLRIVMKRLGKTREEVYDMIPIYASPLHWLVEYTGDVAIWYGYAVVPPNISQEQKNVIKMLQNNSIIDTANFKVAISKEMTLTSNE